MTENTPLHSANNPSAVQGFHGENFSRRFSVAPMMDWTTSHFRYLTRQLSRHALL